MLRKSIKLANSTHGGGETLYKINSYLPKIKPIPHIKNITYY